MVKNRHQIPKITPEMDTPRMNSQTADYVMIVDDVPPAATTPETYLATGTYAEHELIEKVLKFQNVLVDALPESKFIYNDNWQLTL